MSSYSRGLVTNSQLFAKLGDPWITEKERTKTFPTYDDENPLVDYRFAKKQEREERSSIFSKRKKETKNDDQLPPSRRMAGLGQIARALKKKKSCTIIK